MDVERLHDRGHGELPAVAPVPPRDDRHARVRDSVRVRVRDIFGGELRHHVRGGLRGPPPGNDFRVLLYNVEYYSRNELEFELTARCSASAPCPRPKGAAAGDCSGEGACGAATQADGVVVDHLATTGVCACDAGFGDFGCDKTLRRLEDGVSVSVQLGSGEWSYFDFEVTAPAAYGADPSVAMLVDLRRAAVRDGATLGPSMKVGGAGLL